MNDAQIKALGYTAVEDGLPDEAPHKRAYLLIEEDTDWSKPGLLHALAEWDPQQQIGTLPRQGGFVICHYFAGEPPRRTDNPDRANLKLRYWKALERLNDDPADSADKGDPR